MPHINVTHTSNGRNVQLQIADPPRSGINADIPAIDIGHFVTGLLGEATECAKITEEYADLVLREGDKRQLQYTRANGVALTDKPDQDGAYVLTFAIGATELSIGLHKDNLVALGKSLLTLSADPSKAQ